MAPGGHPLGMRKCICLWRRVAGKGEFIMGYLEMSKHLLYRTREGVSAGERWKFGQMLSSFSLFHEVEECVVAPRGL